MNWLWKKLGYHVCEDFTPWEQCSAFCWLIPAGRVVTRLYKARCCKTCGKRQTDAEVEV